VIPAIFSSFSKGEAFAARRQFPKHLKVATNGAKQY
jgi:hypothetical protein